MAKIAAIGDRRAGDRARDRGRRGLQRLRARRPGVLLRLERELPGAAARAVVAALQHDGRGRSGCSRGVIVVGRADRAERPGVAGRRLRRRRRSARSALDNPAIFCIPIGFLGCCLGHDARRREKGNERSYHELYVRSETGLGAEGAEPVRRRARSAGPARSAAAATQVRRSSGSRPASSSSRGSSSGPDDQPAGRRGAGGDLLAARLEAAGLEVTPHELGEPERTSLVARRARPRRRRARAVPDRPPRHRPAGRQRLVARPVRAARSTATGCTAAGRAT